MFFFQLSTLVVTLILFVVMIGATALGHFVGAREHGKSEANSEPFGVERPRFGGHWERLALELRGSPDGVDASQLHR